MTIIALFSNKGGVGKTAAAVNLAYLAAQSGMQTLICDLDPQSASTFYFRVKPKLKRKARGLAKGGDSIKRSIKGTDYEKLDLLPADFTHRNLDITFDRLRRSKHRLSMALWPIRDAYDLIVLDCPPTINILAENIFNASDFLLVPVVPSTLSIRTYKQLLAFLEGQGRAVEKVYAFFSMIDKGNPLHREQAYNLYKQYARILWSPIPYLQDIERMGITREPVPAYAPDSLADKAYRDLWGEIQKKLLSK